MKKTIIMLILAMLFPVIVSGSEPTRDAPVESIHVLKISAQDGRAVIKTSDGKAQVLKEGDVLRLAGSEVRVMEIAEGRVVLEERKGRELERVIIRLESGKQRVERMRKAGGTQPVILAPAVKKENK